MLRQYGVLPYRPAEDGGFRLLLITSRETKRWVVPRGNPMAGLDPYVSAAHEAFEEAGVTGETHTEPIGSYHYQKRRRKGALVPAEVTLFPLKVTGEATDWPERAERERRWFEPEEAARAVNEGGLQNLIRAFVPPSPERLGVAVSLCYGPQPVKARTTMLNWFKALMPKEDRFFTLFADHAATLVAGAEAMRRMFAMEEDIAACCRQITDYEHQADDITRDVLLMVRRTFITPFDRSAITDLVSSMDDAIDEMHKTAKAITLFEVNKFEPQMQQMSALAAQAAALVVQAVPLLRSIGNNGGRIDGITEKIVQIEEQADGLHENGLKSLFQSQHDTPMNFIVGREIYSHLERVLDRFEDVANQIQGIVIDHA